jgi:[acyl-carrier-protein] S-malonyltransferase
MTLWSRLQADLPRPICAAGYSLGEMAACSAAGAFKAVEGLHLCIERARLDGSGRSRTIAVCSPCSGWMSRWWQASLPNPVWPSPSAMRPGITCVAGPRAGIDAAAPRLEAAGASRLVHLAVHTPSHTALLAAAAVNFEKQLNLLPERRLAFPVLSAIDATPARSSPRRPQRPGPADLHTARLGRTACKPCSKCSRMWSLKSAPGNALARLFAELAPNVPVRACDDFRSNDGVVSWVRSYS